MIKVSNLNKYFNKGRSNELHVINNVSLELPEKGFVTILGKSGSGKTTLLNVIGGLDTFNDGKIIYEEEAFAKYKMGDIDKYRSKNIGYIFQNYLVMPEETVFENVDTSLKLAGIQDKAERKKRANEALKAVGMSKYRRKTANSLSGGQKQRIGIARAIAKLPKIIIADEPTGNLDSENSIEIMAILRDISKNNLVVMVTHNERLAKNFADRIIHYRDGQIIKDEVNIPNDDLQGLLDNSRSKIYLSDLKKKTSSKDGINAEVYYEKDSKFNLDLKLIEKNGKKYLFVDDEDIIVNDTSVTLLNEHPKEEEKEDKISTFDNSSFNEVVRKPVPFFNLLKQAFYSFFSDAKLKTTAYKILSGLMGVGISIVSMMTYYTFYTPDYRKSLNTMETSTLSVSSIETSGGYFEKLLQSDLLAAVNSYDESKVKGVVTSVTVDADNFGLGKLTGETTDFAHAYIHVPSVNGNTPKVSLGKQPTEANEIAVSDGLISLAMPNYLLRGYKYESLLNKPFYRHDGIRIKSHAVDVTPNLVGIVHNDVPTIYLPKSNEYALYEGLISTSEDSFTLLKEVIFKNRDSVDFVVPASDESLRVAEKANVWISTGAAHYFNKNYAADYKLFNVMGTFENDGVLAIFDNNDDLEFYKETIGEKSVDLLTFTTDIPASIEIVDGRAPTKSNEILVNELNTCEQFAFVDRTVQVEIVGHYKNAEGNFNFGEIYTPFTTIYSMKSYGSITQLAVPYAGDISNNYLLAYTSALYSDNFKATESFINARHSDTTFYTFKLTKDALRDANNELLRDTSTLIMIVVNAAVIALMLVLVLISTRSNMIRHIYSISVFRSLGTTKRDVYRIFISKDLINYLFTIFLGVLLTFVGDWIFAASFGLFAVPFWVFLIAVVVTYGISLLGTMIPLWSLLAKTPNQISSKYDI